MHPTVGVLRTIHVPGRYQSVLCSQEYAVDALGRLLGYHVNLVHRVPTTEDIVFGGGAQSRYYTGMLAGHGVLAICRLIDQLAPPSYIIMCPRMCKSYKKS